MDVNVRKRMVFHLCLGDILGDILIFTKRGKADRIEATKKEVVPVNNKKHSPQELARWLEETWGKRAPFWPIVFPRESKAPLFMKRSGMQCRWR